jgi:type II secretory pathway predicted ATPase ExeA
MAFSYITSDRVVESTALLARQIADEIESASNFPPGGSAASRESLPMEGAAAAVDGDSSVVADDGPANFSRCHSQQARVKVRGTELAVRAKEQAPPKNFLEFYGLNQQPFDVTPDPAYLYMSRAHREALTSLTQGVENLRGFMTLVANPGLGKTTLMNKLTEDLGDKARVVHLFQTQCSASELPRYLLSELGVKYDPADSVAMHHTLNEVLFQEMLQGRRFVLIVDEAQNLQESVLETIRLLSDYETTHSKLIQIILTGQPQLVQTLMRPGLSQLRQRIGIVANLKALDAPEVAEYIEHRLRTAGSSGNPVFSRDAVNRIAEESEGAPRSINNLCFNALLQGFSARQQVIDAGVVEKAANQLDLEAFAKSCKK